MKRIFIVSVLLAVLPLRLTQAGLTDRNQPFTIEADTATYSDVTQTAQFSGRVVLTQGSMQITANAVETVVDPEGYQYATAKGNVVFKQQRDGTDEWIQGQGEQLVYDGKDNTITLVGDKQPAQIRRVSAKGGLIDQISGHDLNYNQLTEVFTGNAQGTGRTHVIVSPTGGKEKR